MCRYIRTFEVLNDPTFAMLYSARPVSYSSAADQLLATLKCPLCVPLLQTSALKSGGLVVLKFALNLLRNLGWQNSKDIKRRPLK